MKKGLYRLFFWVLLCVSCVGCTTSKKPIDPQEVIAAPAVMLGDVMARVIENPTQPRFNVRSDCLQWVGRHKEYKQQRPAIDAETVKKMDDVVVTVDLLFEKKGCNLDLARAEILGAEVDRRKLLTVREVSQIGEKNHVYLNLPQILIEADRITNIAEPKLIKSELFQSGIQYEIWHYDHSEGLCRDDYIFQNGRVVGYHADWCGSFERLPDENQGIDL